MTSWTDRLKAQSGLLNFNKHFLREREAKSRVVVTIFICQLFLFRNVLRKRRKRRTKKNLLKRLFLNRLNANATYGRCERKSFTKKTLKSCWMWHALGTRQQCSIVCKKSLTSNTILENWKISPRLQSHCATFRSFKDSRTQKVHK